MTGLCAYCNEREGTIPHKDSPEISAKMCCKPCHAAMHPRNVRPPYDELNEKAAKMTDEHAWGHMQGGWCKCGHHSIKHDESGCTETFCGCREFVLKDAAKNISNIRNCRVWLVKEKRMVTGTIFTDTRGRVFTQHGSSTKYPNTDSEENWFWLTEHKDAILMWSTGSEDKKSKEIFRDDVVSYETRKNGKWVTLVGKVIWDEESASFEIDNDDFYNDEGRLFGWVDLKLLGNIHKNPSLLKGVSI